MKLFAVAGLLLLGQTPQFVYRSADQYLTVYKGKTFDIEYLPNGDVSFRVDGGADAVHVESKLDGLKISSNLMSGVESKVEEEIEREVNKKIVKDKVKRSYFKQLDADGNTTLTLDSASQYEAAISQAERLQIEPPEKPTSTEITTLRTKSLTYTGVATDGNLVVASPFTVESDSQGKVNETSFTQKLTASGVSANFTLDPRAKPKEKGKKANPIRTGTIMGPVKVNIDRTETKPDEPLPVRINITCSADKVDVNLVGERTITFTGNVKLDGNNGVYTGSSTGAMAVITLDENMKPVKIRITGEPVDSRFKKAGGGK